MFTLGRVSIQLLRNGRINLLQIIELFVHGCPKKFKLVCRVFEEVNYEFQRTKLYCLDYKADIEAEVGERFYWLTLWLSGVNKFHFCKEGEIFDSLCNIWSSSVTFEQNRHWFVDQDIFTANISIWSSRMIWGSLVADMQMSHGYNQRERHLSKNEN